MKPKMKVTNILISVKDIEEIVWDIEKFEGIRRDQVFFE